LKTHIALHELNRDHHCTECPASFNTAATLRKHGEIHKDFEKPFLCDEPECQWRFKNEKGLRLHKHTHIKTNDWNCQLCTKSLKTKDNLRRHTIVCHGEGFEKVPCTICKKSFAKKHIKSHLRSHSSLRAYKCQLCHKSFKTFEAVSKHEKSHEKPIIKKEPVKCPKCPKLFTGLLKHKFINRSKKITINSFLGLGQLGSHLQIHEKKNNVCECDICGIQAKNHSHILLHMEAHISKLKLYYLRV
jgi:KRAB domain-containing zinc finger protein